MFDQLADRFDPPSTRLLELWAADRVAFLHDAFDWDDGGPADYQDTIAAALDAHDRVAVRAPHGAGKSTTAACMILHGAVVWDGLGYDWKIPSTASVWRQLAQYLWPEIHKMARKLRADQIGRPLFAVKRELLDLSLSLRHGEAFALASADPATLEGAHADWLMYVFDESKAIKPGVWEAAEGAFSGAGADTVNTAKALAISTPGAPSGEFYNIHSHKPGYEDWHTIHVTLDDAIRAGRVSRDWADRRAVQWGQQSAVYLNRVCGEFASSDEQAVIPLEWVEAAIERWHAAAGAEHGPVTAMALDVARLGEDRTVLATARGDWVEPLATWPRQETTTTSDDLVRHLRANAGVVAQVDCDGLGVGVYDGAKKQIGRGRVAAYHGSAKTLRRDRSGELRFANVRAAAWWSLREELDPAYESGLCLPDDDALVGDLTGPHWFETAQGKIQIEPKDDVKSRLGRSPDAGDAVVMCRWRERPSSGGRSSARQIVGSSL